MWITTSWANFFRAKRQASWRRILRVALAVTLVRSLLFPLPVFAAVEAGPLIARLGSDVDLSVTGRVLRDRPTGATLATIGGTALLNPAMPVTVRGRRFTSAGAVPVGSVFRILATGYSSTPDQTDATPFITASGTHVHDGTIATNFLPFGTRVRFINYRPGKVFVVEDRHHPRLSTRADIWFETRHAAITFGAQVLRAEVVE